MGGLAPPREASPTLHQTHPLHREGDKAALTLIPRRKLLTLILCSTSTSKLTMPGLLLSEPPNAKLESDPDPAPTPNPSNIRFYMTLPQLQGSQRVTPTPPVGPIPPSGPPLPLLGGPRPPAGPPPPITSSGPKPPAGPPPPLKDDPGAALTVPQLSSATLTLSHILA